MNDFDSDQIYDLNLHCTLSSVPSLILSSQFHSPTDKFYLSSAVVTLVHVISMITHKFTFI